MNIDNFFQSKGFKYLIMGVFCFIILVFVFKMGMFIGTIKANFSFKWAEQYHRNFAGPEKGFFGDFKDDFKGQNFIVSSGVFGQIIKIDGWQLTISGPKDLEKVIIVSNETIIRFLKEDKKLSDLKVNDNIVVIGEANNSGQIEAKLIRVIPPTPNSPVRLPFRPIFPRS